MEEIWKDIPRYKGYQASNIGRITKEEKKMLKFSDIRIRKIESTNRCKAIVSIVVNNALCINNIKIIESQNGLFIAMPNIRTANGEFKDLVFPLNQETREAMQKAILDEYNKV